MIRVLLVALAVASLSAPAWPAEPALLRVGMDTRTPPWSFVPGLDYSKEDAKADPVLSEAQLKKLVGLDVDVASALARRLGAAGVKIVPVSWFGTEQGLLAK